MKTSLNLLLILSFLGVYACSGNADEKSQSADLELEKQKIELEKEKLKLEKEKQQLELDRLNQEKEKQEREAVILKLEKKFLNVSYASVVVNRTYFHSEPNENSKSGKKFLVRDDQCEIIKLKNGFGFIEFYNPIADKSTSGWIDLNHLEPFEPGC
jgi:hypothetical protein